MDEPIPVTVITGFLGAGKSTLLERWLAELPREGTVVIVNEQAEVGIDGERLAARAGRIREITGGCVCCQAQGELDAALVELASGWPRPDRILVETSGAASPAGVIRAVTWGSEREGLRLDGVVTVLDASRARAVLAFDLATEQLGFADVAVLSHADRCGPAELDALEVELGRLAPAAVVTRSRRGAVEDDVRLLELLARRGEGMAAVGERHEKQHGIDAVSLMLEGDLDEERFGAWVEDALGSAQARILRVKGILAVRGVEERVVVQGVGESIEVTVGSAWAGAQRHSRLVVLGLGLDGDVLRAGFSACAAASRPAGT